MTVTHGEVNPADRKMYQLRSVTATIESSELIVASIASKQLAIPADRLLLDVRYGPGSFFENRSTADETSGEMVRAINEGGVPLCSFHRYPTAQWNQA